MGYVGICHQSDYVATKHGLVGMQESLYYEMQKMYKTPNVRTSIAMIGHTKTREFSWQDKARYLQCSNLLSPPPFY